MCQIDDYIVLSETEDLQITYCKKCKNFTLAYKSCCSSFTAAELEEFGEIVGSLHPIDFQYNMMGKMRAVVKNPFVSIGFCLTVEEAEEMTIAIRESLALFEAFHVIYQ